MKTDKEISDRVELLLAELMEHFDAVQVLASRVNEHGNTVNVYVGRGNWYALDGMAREFVDQGLARVQAREIARELDQPEE